MVIWIDRVEKEGHTVLCHKFLLRELGGFVKPLKMDFRVCKVPLNYCSGTEEQEEE